MTGLLAESDSGPVLFACNRVVVATGGVGGLYNTAPIRRAPSARASRSPRARGAVMGDLEFVQFHPTALDAGPSPLKLISETVRGEGAILIDERGRRFMADVEGAELAPRDVVARAVHAELAAGHRVFLDARKAIGARFSTRFPAIAGFCRAAGIDPRDAADPGPSGGALPYGRHQGRSAGRSSLEGLWACGEAACTGLHGANRLASNSLLEAVVCGGFVAESVAAASPPRRRTLVTDLSPMTRGDPAPVRKIMSRASACCATGKLCARPPRRFSRSPGAMTLERRGDRRPHDRGRGAAARGEPGRPCAHRFSEAAVKAERTTLRLADACAQRASRAGTVACADASPGANAGSVSAMP